MTEPLVSIVVTSYNYGHYLRAAIDSALAQDLPSTEVIVVDDGSSDDSPDIIRRYGDRITAVLKPNGGQASAFNAGFALAAGTAVVFLDSDDVLYASAAASAVRALDDPAVHVHWPMEEIDAEGTLTGRRIPHGAQRAGDLLEEMARCGPLADLHTPTSGNAWSRRFLDQVMPMPEADFVVAPDAYLFTLSPTYGHLRHIDTPLSAYRGHGSNAYHTRALSLKLGLDVRLWDVRCRLLEQRFADLGRRVDTTRWRGEDTPYGWMLRCSRTLDEIARVIPEGARYVLLEAGEFGHGDVVPGRCAVPLIERDGMDFGPPQDDAAAIAALADQWASGARYLILLFPAFWWRDIYRGFIAYVRVRYRRVLENERLVAFDLDTCP